MRLFTGKPALLTILAIAGGLSVSACGDKSTDTVDNSEITEMNAIGMAEGTTNDASALDMATDTNVATANAMDNAAADMDNASANATDTN